MRRKTSLLLAFVLLVTLVSIGSGGAAVRGGSSCLQNPPPNCDFDPVCLQYCAALHPKDLEARCLCGLGCCMPIE